MLKRLTAMAMVVYGLSTTATGTDHEIVCLEYPLYDDGVNCLYAGDYYEHSETSPGCGAEALPRYKWGDSNWAVPEGCPNCGDAYGRCDDDVDEKEVDTEKKQNQEDAKAKNQAKQAKDRKMTGSCKKLDNPIPMNFVYDNSNNLSSRFAVLKGSKHLNSNEKWKPQKHIKVVSTSWALVKVKNTNNTIPVKCYILQLDQKAANEELLNMTQTVEKFKKELRLVRIGFEADGIPNELMNIMPVKPAPIGDGSCKTMCFINVDGETDPYFITTATEVVP